MNKPATNTTGNNAIYCQTRILKQVDIKAFETFCTRFVKVCSSQLPTKALYV